MHDRPFRFRSLLATVLLATALAPLPATAQTWLASVTPDGDSADDPSWYASPSGNARVVAFESLSDEYVPGDDNGAPDIFLYDRWNNTTTRASVSSNGIGGNFASNSASLSDDGTVVAFESSATNLIRGDTNGNPDIYVRHVVTQTTTRVSVSTSGQQGNGYSFTPHLSADGSTVVFLSTSDNLVTGDTNNQLDVFAHDIATGVTTRVNVDSSGAQSSGMVSVPRVSDDGRYVVFVSTATDLVPGTTHSDVFRHDRLTGETVRVSESIFGGGGNSQSNNPDISADGNLVVYDSNATDLTDSPNENFLNVYLTDMTTQTTVHAVVDSSGGTPNSSSLFPTISADGNRIAFLSGADDLVPGDLNGFIDAFVRDLSTGITERASVSTFGAEASGSSYWPQISSHGNAVVFQSNAENLVSHDANGFDDVFVFGPWYTLEIIPPSPIPFEPIEIRMFEGDEGAPLVMRVVELNGSPFFLNLVVTTFDQHGNFSLRGVTPPGLSGLSLGLQGLALAPDGGAAQTEVETLRFQ